MMIAATEKLIDGCLIKRFDAVQFDEILGLKARHQFTHARVSLSKRGIAT
jgi:hypothetical protein